MEWKSGEWHEVSEPSKDYIALSHAKTKPQHPPPRARAPRAGRSKRRASRSPSSNGSSPSENYGLGAAKDAPRGAPRFLDVRLLDARTDVAVELTERAAEVIWDACAASRAFSESGGVLAGVTHGHPVKVLVTDVSPPGRHAWRSPTGYRPDATADHHFLQHLERELGGAVRELGGWHSHLGPGDLAPSRQDLQSWAGHLGLVPRGFLVSLIVVPGKDRSIGAAAFITQPDAHRGGDWFTVQRCALDIAGARSWST